MKKPSSLIVIFIALSILYVVFTLITPSDANVLRRYQISDTRAHVLSLTFAIPMVIIWLVSLFGYLRFTNYAYNIGASKDGKALLRLADGLLLLALSLPISTTFNTVLLYFTRSDPNMVPTTTILKNYITLAITLLAFYVLHDGAKKLHGILKKSSQLISFENLLSAWFIIVSGLYAYLTISNPAREHQSSSAALATAYYLPDFLLITTIILPYVAVWFLGISSFGYIYNYGLNVKGTLYRKAIRIVANGIAVVLLSFMAIRFLVAETGWLNGQSLQGLLTILYLLVAGIAAGFVMIALGSNRLKKIEEA